jgi:hypothetical protein
MLFAKKAKWKKAKWMAKNDLYRKFLKAQFINNVSRYAKDQWDDFDADDVLRYAGLTTHKPARVAFGSIGAFVIGAAVGGIAAILLTPKTGVEMRTNVKDKAMGYMGKQGIGSSTEKTASA